MLNRQLLHRFYHVNKDKILDQGQPWAKFILLCRNNLQREQIKKDLLIDPSIKKVVQRLRHPIQGIPSLSHLQADYRVYGSFYWGLRFLADLGFSAEELGISELIHLLQLQQLEDGQFMIRYHRNKQQTISLICMTAHLTYCLIRLGYEETLTVDAALKYILTTQRHDGGWHCDRLRQAGEKNESAPSCPAANIHVIRTLGQYGRQYEHIALPAISQAFKSFKPELIHGCELEANQHLNPTKLRYPPHYTGLDILNIVESLSLFLVVQNYSQFEILIKSILDRWDGINWLRPEKRIPEWSDFDFSKKTGNSSWITSLAVQAMEKVYFKN